MNPFTELVWEVIVDCPGFLEQLAAALAAAKEVDLADFGPDEE